MWVEWKAYRRAGYICHIEPVNNARIVVAAFAAALVVALVQVNSWKARANGFWIRGGLGIMHDLRLAYPVYELALLGAFGIVRYLMSVDIRHAARTYR